MGNVYWNEFQLEKARNQDPSLSIDVIAIGDSWFHYVSCCLLTALQNHIGSCNIYALGANGARADGMGHYLTQLKDYLKTYWTVKVVAVSAGGNDFAGDGDLDIKILKSDCRNIDDIEHCYQTDQPDKLFKEVIGHYKLIVEAIIETIKGTNRHITVLVHNYDYPVPDGRFLELLLFKFGPWLKRPMDKCKVRNPDKPHDGLRRKLCIDLIDKFTRELERLADEYKSNQLVSIQIIRSAGTLDDRESQWQKEWANELHPSTRGFKKIAEKCWKDTLRKALSL